jgi:hypothetical protein
VGQPTPKNPDVVLAHLSLALALKEQGYLAAAADELEAFASATAQPTAEMSAYQELKEAMLLYRGKLSAMIGEISTRSSTPSIARSPPTSAPLPRIPRTRRSVAAYFRRWRAAERQPRRSRPRGSR